MAKFLYEHECTLTGEWINKFWSIHNEVFKGGKINRATCYNIDKITIFI